ncbi:MAG: 5'-nucleotidase C-terminal domain-containing protein [Bacteroidales bacterium]|nr:5'-nucleotidase C-terminal domain-containing protein [Bacteroidales bacterium]
MRIAAILLLGSLLLSPIGAQPGKKITIIHTNDMHSRLTGYSPELAYSPQTVNDDNTVGGFARIATIINNEKKNSDGLTLVLDAGDFLMGTLFQGLEPTTGFQLRLMKTMGYDVVCIGNHEFDFGPGKLASIIKSAASRGTIPPVLLSNAVFSDQDPADDELSNLYNKKLLSQKLIITREGIKIGFFSLMGVEADDNAAYAAPVTFSKQIPAAKKFIRELQDEGCDIIICLSHSGVSKGKSGEWSGEDVKLAEKVKGIDVVGKLVLDYDDGNLTLSKYTLFDVDDRIPGDPVIASMIDEQKRVVTEEILDPIGLDYSRPLAESDFLLECNEQGDFEGSNLGPLVADAIHGYVNNHVAGGTQVSMVAVGVIRDSIVPGLQSAPDIFSIMSMGIGKDNIPGYPLSRLYVTGHELKGVLEIMYIAGQSTPGNYLYYAGIKVDFDPDRGLLKKIRKITIVGNDGSTSDVDFSKQNRTLYSIVANSYILEYVGIIKNLSKGLVKVVPKDVMGAPITDMKSAIMDFNDTTDGLQEGKEWLAIVEYLTAMKDVNGNGIPDIDPKYKVAIKTFTVVESK